MEKQIKNYNDYKTAIIKGVTIDGLILCDLLGNRTVMRNKYNLNGELEGEEEVILPLHETSVSVENGKYFTLTSEEIKCSKHFNIEDNATHN